MQNYFKRIGSKGAAGIIMFDDSRPGPRPSPVEFVIWKRTAGLEAYREIGEDPDYLEIVRLTKSNNPIVEANALALLRAWRDIDCQWTAKHDAALAALKVRVAA